ncbi:hypothetical protein GCM10009863_18480 [Streptomyces axinellae]|uniref:Uncharacterized protein n=1 Tax=Streptomyces axinellae TaxID=552788 RepID=A0ABP6CAH6_9ACTN
MTYEVCDCGCHRGAEGICMWMYDRERTPMPSVPQLRLLPWSTDSGKPCYLNGEPGSPLSFYADELEDAQLEDGGRALKRIMEILDRGPAAGDDETTLAVKEAAAALSNVLRVADSRGARLPDPDSEDAGATFLSRYGTPGDGARDDEGAGAPHAPDTRP